MSQAPRIILAPQYLDQSMLSIAKTASKFMYSTSLISDRETIVSMRLPISSNFSPDAQNFTELNRCALIDYTYIKIQLLRFHIGRGDNRSSLDRSLFVLQVCVNVFHIDSCFNDNIIVFTDVEYFEPYLCLNKTRFCGLASETMQRYYHR